MNCLGIRLLDLETEEYVNTGVGFGAEIGNKIVEGMLNEYNLLMMEKHGTRGMSNIEYRSIGKKGSNTKMDRKQ